MRRIFLGLQHKIVARNLNFGHHGQLLRLLILLAARIADLFVREQACCATRNRRIWQAAGQCRVVVQNIERLFFLSIELLGQSSDFNFVVATCFNVLSVKVGAIRRIPFAAFAHHAKALRDVGVAEIALIITAAQIYE